MSSKHDPAIDELKGKIDDLEMIHPKLLLLLKAQLVADAVSIHDLNLQCQRAYTALPHGLPEMARHVLDELPLSIALSSCEVQKIVLNYQDPDRRLQLQGKFTARDLHVLHLDSVASSKIVGAPSLSASLSSIMYISSPYKVTLNEVSIHSKEESLSVHSIKLIPLYSLFEFSRKLGYQSDRIEAGFTNLSLRGLQWGALLGGTFHADDVTIQHSSFFIFRDRRVSRHPVIEPLPVNMLNKLPVTIRIKKVQLFNSSVTYEEYPADLPKTGHLKIKDLYVSLSPVLNHAISSDPDYMIMHASGSLMGSGKLFATMRLPLHSDQYEIEGAFTNLDLTTLNDASENLGKIHIKSGLLDSLGFNCRFTNKKAGGKIIGIYHHLEIEPLKKNNKGEMKVARFRSFALRHVVIPYNKDRTLDVKKRTGIIDYPHDPDRFVSYYLLQALLTGIKSSFALGFLLPK